MPRKIPEFKLIASYVSLCESRSFTLSSLDLGITQSALSQQIIKLEKILSTPLIDRKSKSKKLVLTEKGEEFLVIGTRIIKNIESEIQTFNREMSSEYLVIGISYEFDSVVKEVIQSLGNTLSIKFLIEKGLSKDIYKSFSQDKLDIAIVKQLKPKGSFSSKESQYFWVARDKDILKSNEPFGVVTYKEHGITRQHLEENIRNLSINYYISSSEFNDSQIANAAASGFGLAITSLEELKKHGSLSIIEELQHSAPPPKIFTNLFVRDKDNLYINRVATILSVMLSLS